MNEHHMLGRHCFSITLLCLWGLYAITLAQAQEPPWQRNQQDLLKNFDNMYNPCVVEVGGEYRYRMWFFGWAADHGNKSYPGCDAIFHARSKDLTNWEVYCGEQGWDHEMNPSKWVPVIHASERWYEAWHVGDPSVVQHDGKFYMAYSATSLHFSERAGYPAAMVQCIMGGVSHDGIHWEKTTQPLLFVESDTADPQPNSLRIGDFHRPSLRREDGRWRLWFDYWIPGKGVCMGHAENEMNFESPGAFRLSHPLAQPLIQDWPNPDVIRIGSRYHCFADPPGYPIDSQESSWKSRQLREAISDDGVHWRLLDFIAPDSDSDACHVPQVLLTEIDGHKWLYLFYATQIGYKKNDQQYHYQYDRIRAMRRPVANLNGADIP